MSPATGFVSAAIAHSILTGVDMIDHTLTEAWTIWWSSQSLAGDSILGISVLLISRIGKGVQFLGGFLILVEILSPQWFQEIGKALKGSVKSLARMFSLWSWLRVYYEDYKLKPDDPRFFASRRERELSFEEIRRDPLSFVSLLLAFALTGCAWYYSPFQSAWMTAPLAVAVLGLSVTIFAPILAVVFITLVLAIPLILYSIVAKLVGWTFDQEHLEWWAKTLAFCAIVVGTLLDFVGP